ncbi:MAG: amidase [Janthinobacterium lividum]
MNTPDDPSRIVDADALTLARWIRTRAVSCREVMHAYLAQIDRCNPAVNAIVSRVAPETLLAQADACDALLAAGRYLGPLHGFPQAPKDLAAVHDLPTSMGSPLFAGTRPAADAIFVERLRRGGAIFVGRTNTPEFGLGGQTYNAVFGKTRNAWDTTKTSAGSSGGAAVALATRMLPVADGSDMMGSLRTPAAFNHVFGFRGSRGVIPSGPGPELYLNQFSYDGPMARNVPDLAMLLGVMAGHDPRAPLSLGQAWEDGHPGAGRPARFATLFAQGSDATAMDLSSRGWRSRGGASGSASDGAPDGRPSGRPRIGWLADLDGHLAVEPEVLAICRHALGTFRTLGCDVEEIRAAELAFPLDDIWQSWTTLRSFLIAGNLGALYQDPGKRALMKPELQWEIARGLALSGSDVYAASVRRSAWHQRLRVLFERFDFLVLPAAQVLPFDVDTPWPREIAGRPMDTYHRWMEAVIPASLVGAPVISAPAGFSATGLPMGIQIIGAVGADEDVLRLAHAYDVARGRADRQRPATADFSGTVPA